MLRLNTSTALWLSQAPSSLLTRSTLSSSSSSSQSAVHLATARTLAKRQINTQQTRFFSGANRNARDLVAHQKPPSTSSSSSSSPTPIAKESIEKTRNELLDKLGSNSSGTVVISAGPTPTASTSTSAASAAGAGAATASNSALPHGKVFTVRPITSWIDKLASQHGSPTGTHNPITSPSSPPEPGKKYNKRELVLKTMQDSYTEIILPFKTDKALLEEYINVGGTLR
ncbi:hypothetical protein BGZ94_005542 [Podila epigama]|nr:hypothetical protein BGZ94_005542 [Podila epigama]